MSEENFNQQEATPEGGLIIAPFMLSILARFAPASNPLEATHFFTTAEIARAIGELSPYLKGYTLQDVHDAMYNMGYLIASPHGTIGLSFKWMLRER